MKPVARAVTILALAMSTLTAQAGEERPTASVTDTAGVTTEVTDLRFSAEKASRGQLAKFDRSYRHIAVGSTPFDIAMPLDNVIAIEREAEGEKNRFSVRYVWRGKELAVTGPLVSGEFTGKSDFGDLKLNTKKLRSITFDEAPKPAKEDKPANRATLILADGTEVAVQNLKRHDSYYSTEGYIMGGETRYLHYADLRFLRGESLVTLHFSKIKRIEFTGEKSMSVTLKNGKNATADLLGRDDARILGWTGVFEKGQFFIGRSAVKAIEFGSP